MTEILKITETQKIIQFSSEEPFILTIWKAGHNGYYNVHNDNPYDSYCQSLTKEEIKKVYNIDTNLYFE